MLFDLVFSLLETLPGAAPYELLFVLLFLCGIGAPLSEDLLLIAAAGLKLQWLPLVAVAWLGLVAGDALGFFFGRHYGARWIRRPWAARFVPPDKVPALQGWMQRFGAPFTFVTRFLPGQRGMLFFIAGTLSLPYRSFFLWNGIAAAVYVAVLVTGARALHWHWVEWQAPLSRADDILSGALVLLLVLLWLRNRRPHIVSKNES
jgi:membrane protein DedA with SNARE-associated domain